MYDSFNMPYFKDGTVPDIISSPHGILSRMTGGHILEPYVNTKNIFKGERSVKRTMHPDDTFNKTKKFLNEMGLNPSGKSVMYDPYTGKELKVRIFTGFIFYHRLYFMTLDKIHCRARGPKRQVNNQATVGKEKYGGLRVGEMEKDNILGHGAPFTLRDRYSSDLIKVIICNKCGFMSYENYNALTKCDICKRSGILKSLILPFNFLKLIYIMQGIHIKINIILKND